MNKIAVMQGRLLPPEDGQFQSFPTFRWRDEFLLAAEAGLSAIEWIYDVHGETINPIASDEGICEIRQLSTVSGVVVRSLCADYFMDRPFLRTRPDARLQRIEKMNWLLSRCEAAGIGRIVIPFVDQSKIGNEDELNEVAEIITELVPTARTKSIELHLETNLPPQVFASLLRQCPDDIVRVTYDSGNSASLGYRVDEEFSAYGHRIGSVHVKDRLLGSGTVPLGSGNADLESLFNGLAALEYQGDFVLQVARANPGEEVRWIAHNNDWVKAQIETAQAHTA